MSIFLTIFGNNLLEIFVHKVGIGRRSVVSLQILQHAEKDGVYGHGVHGEEAGGDAEGPEDWEDDGHGLVVELSAPAGGHTG